MRDYHETALNYLVEDEHMTFCTCEKKWINRINKLKEEHPDDVDITDYPESNHGYMVVHLPKSWFTIRVPRKLDLTDEQREAMAEHMRQVNQNRQWDVVKIEVISGFIY